MTINLNYIGQLTGLQGSTSDYMNNVGVPTGVTPPVDNMSLANKVSLFFDTIGNTKSTWSGNIFNASVSGILKGVATLASIGNYRAVYNYFNKQQQEEIANGIENARRAQLAGDVALAKLRVSHALNQGSNELAAAAGEGRLSGSNLDKLVANYRFNQMDERTQQIETLWEVSNRKRTGYINALNTSYQAMSYAHQVKNKAWDAVGNFLETTNSAIQKDIQAQSDIRYKEATLEAQQKYNDTLLKGLYGSLYNEKINQPVQLNVNNSEIGVIEDDNFPTIDLDALRSMV